MKLSFVCCSAFLSLSAVPTVFAASGVDLTVKGLITPSACVPSLSGGGVVDYGKISAQDLNPTGRTDLPESRVQLTVTCEATTLMAVMSLDNRQDSSSGLPYFGLGWATGGVTIGGYVLKTENSTGDGVPSPMIETDSSGMGWMEADGMLWQTGWMRTLNGGSGHALVPLPMRVLKTEVTLSPWLNDKSTMPIAQEIHMDGSVSFTVKYL